MKGAILEGRFGKKFKSLRSVLLYCTSQALIITIKGKEIKEHYFIDSYIARVINTNHKAKAVKLDFSSISCCKLHSDEMSYFSFSM